MDKGKKYVPRYLYHRSIKLYLTHKITTWRLQRNYIKMDGCIGKVPNKYGKQTVHAGI